MNTRFCWIGSLVLVFIMNAYAGSAPPKILDQSPSYPYYSYPSYPPPYPPSYSDENSALSCTGSDVLTRMIGTFLIGVVHHRIT